MTAATNNISGDNTIKAMRDDTRSNDRMRIQTLSREARNPGIAIAV